MDYSKTEPTKTDNSSGVTLSSLVAFNFGTYFSASFS